MFGYAESELGLMVKLFRKNSNLYVITIHQRHRQTDGQTDDMRSQSQRPRFALTSTSRSKNGRRTLHDYINKAESPANVNARQQCMYEGL